MLFVSLGVGSLCFRRGGIQYYCDGEEGGSIFSPKSETAILLGSVLRAVFFNRTSIIIHRSIILAYQNIDFTNSFLCE
jgi:hypothetical protein